MGRLNVELPDQQHQRWKDAAAESPEFSSLSELVRYAVERHLSGDNKAGGDVSNGLDPETVAAIRETNETVGKIETKATALQERVVERDELTELVEATLRRTVADMETPAEGQRMMEDEGAVRTHFERDDDEEGGGVGKTTVEMLSDDDGGDEDE